MTTRPDEPITAPIRRLLESMVLDARTTDWLNAMSALDQIENMLPVQGRVSSEVSHVTADLVGLMVQRDRAGLAKYGVTLDRTDLSATDWLQHQIEELLDAAGYAMRLKKMLGGAK